MVCIGKKGFDLLSGLYEKMFNFEVKHINISEIDYKSTEEIGKKILNSFYKNDFQECSLFYNHFNSVISQEVKVEKLIPYSKSDEADQKIKIILILILSMNPMKKKFYLKFFQKTLLSKFTRQF